MTPEEAKKIVELGERPDNPQYKTALALLQSQGAANAIPAAPQPEKPKNHHGWSTTAFTIDRSAANANPVIDENLAQSSGSGVVYDTTEQPIEGKKPPITETLTPETPQTAGYSGSETSGDSPEDVVQAGSEISKPDEKDTPNETKQKQRYKQTAKSILQSYFEGDIDKSTATYFMLNALSTLARNTGKDIGNIAAQFSGGTIDTSDKEKSLWEQRQGEMFENEVSSEVENMVNTPAFRQMQHDLNSLTTEEQQIFSQAIDNYIKDAGKDLTVDGLRKQIELLGLNVDAARWAQLLHQPILNMVNSGKTSQQILGYILGTAIQAGPSLAQAGMTFLK